MSTFGSTALGIMYWGFITGTILLMHCGGTTIFCIWFRLVPNSGSVSWLYNDPPTNIINSRAPCFLCSVPETSEQSGVAHTFMAAAWQPLEKSGSGLRKLLVAQAIPESCLLSFRLLLETSACV